MMEMLDGLGWHWWWLLAAAVLGILEIFVPGIFLVWMGIAAGVTGIVTAFVPIPFAWQLGLFAILAFAAVYAGRRYYERNPVESSDPHLNVRAARLIGQTVTVEAAFENGKGRVRVGDGVWNARGPDVPAGASVVITAADGTCLTVEPVA